MNKAQKLSCKYASAPAPAPLKIFAPAPAPAPVPLKITVTENMKLSKVSLQVTDLMISYDCCNDLYTLDLNRFQWLRSIVICQKCFESVQTFEIDGLHRLRTLKIEMNSFTEKKNKYGKDESKSFHILNCESLESIDIGQYCFSDFAGDFELKNLPSLRSIKIGNIKNPHRYEDNEDMELVLFCAFNQNSSYNFYNSSFVVRSSYRTNYIMIRSSKSSIYYTR